MIAGLVVKGMVSRRVGLVFGLTPTPSQQCTQLYTRALNICVELTLYIYIYTHINICICI